MFDFLVWVRLSLLLLLRLRSWRWRRILFLLLEVWRGEINSLLWLSLLLASCRFHLFNFLWRIWTAVSCWWEYHGFTFNDIIIILKDGPSLKSICSAYRLRGALCPWWWLSFQTFMALQDINLLLKRVHEFRARLIKVLLRRTWGWRYTFSTLWSRFLDRS